MSVERIIGVDFGTSTSVIRVKRYEDGKPIGDRLETKSVLFNVGSRKKDLRRVRGGQQPPRRGDGGDKPKAHRRR